MFYITDGPPCLKYPPPHLKSLKMFLCWLSVLGADVIFQMIWVAYDLKQLMQLFSFFSLKKNKQCEEKHKDWGSHTNQIMCFIWSTGTLVWWNVLFGFFVHNPTVLIVLIKQVQHAVWECSDTKVMFTCHITVRKNLSFFQGDLQLMKCHTMKWATQRLMKKIHIFKCPLLLQLLRTTPSQLSKLHLLTPWHNDFLFFI